MKLAFYLSGGGITFQRFLRFLIENAVHERSLIRVVVCDFEPCKTLESALHQMDVAVEVLAPKNGRKRVLGEDISNFLLEKCDSYNIDYLFCLGD